MKKFLLYIIILIPWFLSSLLFGNCTNYYDELVLPKLALPQSLYGIVWTILYIIISFSIYKIYSNFKFKEIKNYNIILIINYVFNQLYLYLFFCLKSNLLGLIDSIIILITTLFLYIETKGLDEKAARYLKPYIYFNIYASILSLSIYFLNL